eukprot:3320787-Ditylum_brightwellii.AAC.1
MQGWGVCKVDLFQKTVPQYPAGVVAPRKSCTLLSLSIVSTDSILSAKASIEIGSNLCLGSGHQECGTVIVACHMRRKMTKKMIHCQVALFKVKMCKLITT